ncbi:MAG: prepilin-type N-terminal cleavage/methylation domain-containing protein [Candidatus Omnitrophota bacterium]
MKKGFTLAELLVTIVILSVLAAIAIPGFSKSRDKAAAAQAVAYLRTLRVGEKMYYAKNAIYVGCANATAVKTNLGVEVTEENYKFNVLAPTNSTFFARARKGTAPTDCTSTDVICVDQTGNWSGTSTYVNFTKLNS